MAKLSGLGYRNLPEVVTSALREQILDGVLLPGMRLKQGEIAENFGASLIPVREALRTLEQEGLVVLYPNRGAVVRELSADEAAEIFQTRIILETGALELSLPTLKTEDFEFAAEQLSLLDKAVNGRQLSEHNRLFHTRLYSGCRNSCLLGLIDRLHHNVERYMRVYLLDHYNNDLSQEYHRRILDAAGRGEAALACSLLTEHMQLAMENLTRALG